MSIIPQNNAIAELAHTAARDDVVRNLVRQAAKQAQKGRADKPSLDNTMKNSPRREAINLRSGPGL